jgi:uncharacterized membrane protein
MFLSLYVILLLSILVSTFSISNKSICFGRARNIVSMLYGLISFAVQCRISSIQSILRFPLRLSPISMHSPKIKPVLYGDGIARSDPSVYIIFFLLRLSWDDGHGPRRFFFFYLPGDVVARSDFNFSGNGVGKSDQFISRNPH